MGHMVSLNNEGRESLKFRELGKWAWRLDESAGLKGRLCVTLVWSEITFIREWGFC